MEELNVTNVTTLRGIGSTVQKIVFSWYDYTLFGIILTMSTLIGIYFGCFGKKQTTMSEYLFGGKTMKPFPIAMSIVASHVSGIFLMGIPSDVYRFGFMHWFSCFALIINFFVTNYVYLPVFYKLQVTSAYEYFKLRFDDRVRGLASVLFTLSVFVYLPIVTYIPAIVVAQVTNFNVYLTITIVTSVCIFYTSIGGLKTVVWTDVLQLSLTIGAMIIIFYMGITSAGGFSNIFITSWNGQRLDIDYDLDPTKRDTVWTLVIGTMFSSTAQFTVGQIGVQKYLSVPTMADARWTVFMAIIGMIFVKTMSVFTGLIIYTLYSHCDPLTAGIIKKPDQLFPYHVMDVSSHIPGLSGLYIAGIFCAALSTLSAVMNSAAGILYQDFVARFMSPNTSQKTVSNILKLLVVIVGVVSISLTLVIDRLGGILPVAITLTSIAGGPLLGMFTLGMLFPKATSQGAFYGGVSSCLLISWLVLRTQWYNLSGLFRHPIKPVYTDECSFEFTPINSTISMNPEEVFFIYKISHYYHTLVSVIAGVSVGLIVSFFTKDDICNNLDRDLISPVVYFLMDKKDNTNRSYFTVDEAMDMVTNQDNI